MYIASIYKIIYNVIEVIYMGSSYTEAQKNASIRYLKEKTDSIQIRVPKGKKEEYKQRAERKGESLNAYIIRLIEQDIQNDKKSK